MKRLFGMVVVFTLICSCVTAEAFSFSSITPAESKNKTVVAFEDTQYSVFVGKTHTIKPVIQNYEGKISYSYQSSDTSIATVNEKGMIKGIKAGSTIVNCRVTTENDTFDVYYTLSVLQPVKQIKIDEKSLTLHSYQEYPLNVTILPDDATNKELIWTSSKKGVAFVDENNVVQARAVGTTTLTATPKDGSNVKATIKITIPRVTFESKTVTIDNPKGKTITYWRNIESGSFFITSGSTSNCFDVSELNVFETFDNVEKRIHITPHKVGSGKFVVTINGQQYYISIIVTRDAVYETAKYTALVKDKTALNKRFAITGTVISIDQNQADYTIAILVDDKKPQYALITLPLDKMDTRIVTETKITIKGVFDGMMEYIASNGLSYSVPHFLDEANPIIIK